MEKNAQFQQTLDQKFVTMDKPICVTGATGFIAAHIVQQLLEKGYKVHGTVRDVNKAVHLKNLPHSENLQLFEV